MNSERGRLGRQVCPLAGDNLSLQVEIDGVNILVIREGHSFEILELKSVLLDERNCVPTKIVARAGVEVSSEFPIRCVFFRCSSIDPSSNVLVDFGFPNQLSATRFAMILASISLGKSNQ